MPTYEYFCESCGYVFENFQQMSDEPLRECPQCHKNLKRLIGAGTGVISSKSKCFDHGKTCCGRPERCDVPPCSNNGVCQR